jgi:hypothetical protein
MVSKPKTRTPEEKVSGKRSKTQIAMLVFGVLFAFLMVASYAVPAMSAFKSVKTGDSIQIDCTIRDDAGIPVLTTSQQVQADEYAKKRAVFLTSPLSLVGGAKSSEDTFIHPVPAVIPGITQGDFGLLPWEMDAINEGILGMREMETKKIPINTESSTITVGADESDRLGLNFTEVGVGDRFIRQMTITKNATVFTDPASSISYLRIGKVTQKTSENLTLDFTYATADVTVRSITSA